MDSPLGACLRTISTRNQWATLPSVVKKINKKLSSQAAVSVSALAVFLASIDPDELNDAGIWVQSFGKKYQPIIITNPAYARSRQQGRHDMAYVCTCPQNQNCRKQGSNGRYFTSMDYNAGRHHVLSSDHLGNCPFWTPPTTSHLHSWRRGFDE